MEPLDDDQTRTCIDCGQPYVWDVADQRYARQMGFRPPKYCEACRAMRKRLRRERDSI
jgi:hypothetical protein